MKTQKTYRCRHCGREITWLESRIHNACVFCALNVVELFVPQSKVGR